MSAFRQRAPTVDSALVDLQNRIDLDLTVDDTAVESVTTFSWSGPHVIILQTEVPDESVALDLQSIFVGHLGKWTTAVHPSLGLPGAKPSVASAEADPTYSGQRLYRARAHMSTRIA